MKDLEHHAFFWLRFVKQCPIVLFERSPRQGICGTPDVLGITQSRYLIEFEAKRSISDFRANKAKRSQWHRTQPDKLHLFPRQYYFLMPPKIWDKVQGELPDYAGAAVFDHGLYFPVVAPVNVASKRLTPKECCRAVKLMCSQFYSHFLPKNPEETDWGIDYRI